MAKSLNITLAQLNPTVGDIVGNRDRILETWKNVDGKTDLVIFPELFLCGYPPEDLVLKPAFHDEIDKTVAHILEHSKNFKSGIILPTPHREDDKIYNAAHVIEHGKILGTVHKYHLPNYSVFDEMRVFSSAPLPRAIKFRGLTLGLMICEDMWFPNIAAHLKSEGADLLIVPNGSPYVAGKDSVRINCARTRVQETGLPLLYLNQVGGQDDLVFDGASFAMNEKGDVVHHMKEFEEEISSLTVSSPASEAEPNADRGPGTIHAARSAAPDPRLRGDDIELVYKALTLGLRDYVQKNKFPGILLGLSGGIDSALAAVIATDAIGAANVDCFMLPSQFTSKDSIEDAIELSNNLGIKLDSISIEDSVQSFNTALKLHLKNASGTTFENIQPRARGIILMALSNATGKLLLTTGNKSEMAVGYATLYGDMCGGFNVLKDVYKTQVYELSRWRNRDNIIPERIFTKAPTAELKPNQTDQDTLPPYEILDSILQGLIERDEGVEDLVKKGHDRPTVIKVWKMLDFAEYKRRQSAPGVKITSKAFGRDRRYPITNRFVNIIEK